MSTNKFTVVAGTKTLIKIQREVVKQLKGMDDSLTDSQKGDLILTMYLQVSIDEGYRSALEESRGIFKDLTDVKIKRRKIGDLVYLNQDTLKEATIACRKRIKSKKHREWRAEYCKAENIKDEEETFAISIITNTGFEFGNNEANSIENMVKLVSKDEDRAKMLIELMNEMVG